MSNSAFTIVDDADPAIQYSDGWLNTLPPHSSNRYYKRTAHHTLDAGVVSSNFLYTFTGTDIRVGGEFVYKHTAEQQPLCLVDGNPQEVFPNEWIFCRSHNLTDGIHTLNLSIPMTMDYQIVVDFLLYVPSQSIDTSSSSRDIFQFTADAEIKQQGWTHEESGGIQISAPDATLNLTFTGNSITWFTCPASHKVDSKPNITYTIDMEESRSINDSNLKNLILFDLPLPSSGNHQLNLTYHGDGPEQDIFSLCGIATGNDNLVTGATPQPTGSTSTIMPIATSPTSVATASSMAKNQTAAIVGGVIGGVVFIFLVVLALLLLRVWRIKQRIQHQGLQLEFDPMETQRKSIDSFSNIQKTSRLSIQKPKPIAPVLPKRSSIAKSLSSTFTAYRPSPQTAQVGSEYGYSPPQSPLHSHLSLQTSTSRQSIQGYCRETNQHTSNEHIEL